MNIIKQIKAYIRFLIKAKTAIGHGIHSPFVYQFSIDVLLKSSKKIEKLRSVELLRKKLLIDKRTINVTDLGAGSISGKTSRKVSEITRNASSSQKYCNLLFRIVDYFKPASIIELGTSMGLATASMALANENTKIYTIEGCPAIAQIAKENVESLSVSNIQQYVGDFNSVLPELLPVLNHPFLAFIDGNHRYEPTMRYFRHVLSVSNEQSVIIIDDIHWSEEMELAWAEIKAMPETVTCIDIFRMGIVFFRKGIPKQNFEIRV
jgi:predicted O-methyltransferase YrrM